MKTIRLPQLTGWRAALALFTMSAAALLAACGGGGSDSPSAPVTPPGATASSYSQGPITGFGSIIVGGVRFDESGASVSDEDGGSHDRSELKLGMVVQVDAGTVDRNAATATALRVRFGSEALGPISALSATGFTVLGRTVLVTSSTVFDSTLTGGLAALKLNDVVEVHGILDNATGQVTATRIESETGATAYRLRGLISSLDPTLKTFKIGTELISYAGIATADLPSALANDQVVRVVLNTTQVNGAWVATKLRTAVRKPEAVSDAHVEGLISAWTDSKHFSVNGLVVDATAATFPDGEAGVVLGARVEVEGAVVNGVLVATKVELEDKHNGGMREFELHGAISGLKAADKTFALRGLTVWYGGSSVTFRNGTAATLADGVKVEVKGVLSLDRTRLEATRISFEN